MSEVTRDNGTETRENPIVNSEENEVLKGEVGEVSGVKKLILSLEEQREWIGPGRNLLLLGRSPSSDIIVNKDCVSRTHARVEYRDGRFYLRDESQNGTFVISDSGSDCSLVHHQEIELTASGRLILGQRPTQVLEKDIIRYNVTFDSIKNGNTINDSTDFSIDKTALLENSIKTRPRKRLENHLVLQFLEEYTDKVLVLLTKDGFIRYYNKYLERETRRSYADFIEQDFFSFIHPEDRQGLLDVITQVGLSQISLNAVQLNLRLCTANPRWQEYVFNISQTTPSMQALGLDGIVLVGQVKQQVFDKNLLANRYRIVRSLSENNFSRTYLGEDCQRPSNPRCIIKELRMNDTDPKVQQVSRRLFYQEAITLENLGKHDRIPLLLAYFETNDLFFLVQDYIEGQTLNLIMGQPWAILDAINLLREILLILLYVHRQGVIHRDIKPENIIRRSFDEHYVLIDFGSVKLLPANVWTEVGTSRPLTVVVGTPGYMAPEQALGRPTPASDIYSLGIIIIECLLGLPFDSVRNSWSEVLVERQIDEDFITILKKMTATSLDKRYQNVSDVLIELNYLSIMTVDLNRDIN